MVILNIKSNDSKVFVYEAALSSSVEKVLSDIIRLRNGVQKIKRLSLEIEDLIEHGVAWPSERQGLLQEQADELHLSPNSELSSTYPQRDDIPFSHSPDPRLKRSGLPLGDAESRRILRESALAAKKLTESEPLTWGHIKEGLQIIGGALKIVYTHGIPSFDPVQMELDNNEDLDTSDIWDPTLYCLWFASKALADNEKLSKYLGKNEKSKCIIKVGKRGQGPPPKERPFTEEEERQLLLEQHRRVETLRKLAKEQDESFATWIDSDALKNKFNGMENISWKTGFN
uniref:C21orf59 n=1 Tax=Caligus clemensi TaxID=344056 RepID=C1C1W4_CALCM|nr:C21orf59 [Caligus clemensi]